MAGERRVTLVVYADTAPGVGEALLEESLMACLGSLTKARRGGMEVVCVTDRQRGLGGKLAHRERGGGGSLGERLDRAARAATGDTLVFVPHDARLQGEAADALEAMGGGWGWGWCELAPLSSRSPRLAKWLNALARSSGLPQPEHPLVVDRTLLAAVGGLKARAAMPVRELGLRLRARSAPVRGLPPVRSVQAALLRGQGLELARRFPLWLAAGLRRWWFP